MLFLLVLGKSIILYSLLSLKMAGTSMYTITYQVPFCTSTQALLPAHQVWTAPTISDIHWLECCTAVLSQRSGFKSQQVWILGGAFFSQPHELWRISLDGSCILTFNCFITHSKYFKFIKGYLLIVFFSKLWPISGKVSRYKKMSFEADNPQNKLSKCVDIPVFLPFSFSQKFSSFFVFCNSFFLFTIGQPA